MCTSNEYLIILNVIQTAHCKETKNIELVWPENGCQKIGNSHRRIVFLKTPAAFHQHDSFPTRQPSLRKKKKGASPTMLWRANLTRNNQSFPEARRFWLAQEQNIFWKLFHGFAMQLMPSQNLSKIQTYSISVNLMTKLIKQVWLTGSKNLSWSSVT